jgi:predicted AAA+ superfamily ATPase
MKKGLHPESIFYLSADRFHSPREFRAAVDEFLRLRINDAAGAMFFDEVTAVKGWSREVKKLADEGVTKRFPILVTGSSALALRRETEKMPGRGSENNSYFLRPAPFRSFVMTVGPSYAAAAQNPEFHQALDRLMARLRDDSTVAAGVGDLARAAGRLLSFQRELQFLFDEYLKWGGYPRVMGCGVAKEADATTVAAEFAETIVRDAQGDVAALGGNPSIVQRLLRAISERECQRLSYSALAEAGDTSHVTVREYLDMLQDSFLIHVLEAVDPQRRRYRPRAEKKIHFPDPFVRTAIRSYVLGIPPSELFKAESKDEAALGRAVESAVVAHLIQAFEAPYRKEAHTFIGFAYDPSKREVDVVLERGAHGVEVKYQARVEPGDVQFLAGIRKPLVVTRDDWSGGDTPHVPACLALAAIAPSDRHL